mmetsp:Transcript_53827/g.114945  ORF Transcript_53827/g.114945 Transcript_53827/m.114945 type:complete len:659 (-) Transcript_53827:391-2367(-)|eukprot:CAMPEP_0206481356 /NCGR_PEP_ID=MMETSP0324_2-20121206/38088_1 /ASSEMBLY_ACC=CAM_ASM_000836 /TAXON_ID=2866 /ORGANISM="Crypthecodinium cohnii, Strain Seligo" /LENGTH=658 /DNA_ID=CAMNT_0053958813 /DNA_START=72 /DNA_END=2048 /DNA_ORIENTATION=-
MVEAGEDAVLVDVHVTRLSGDIVHFEASVEERVGDFIAKACRTFKLPSSAIKLICEGEILCPGQHVGELPLQTLQGKQNRAFIELAMVVSADALSEAGDRTKSFEKALVRDFNSRPVEHQYPERTYWVQSRGYDWAQRALPGRKIVTRVSFSYCHPYIPRQVNIDRRRWSKVKWSRIGTPLPENQGGYIDQHYVRTAAFRKRHTFCDASVVPPAEGLDPWRRCVVDRTNEILPVQVMRTCRGGTTVATMQALFEAGADPDAQDKDGNSLFHLACASMDHRLMREILHHSRKRVCNLRGESFLDAALQVLHCRNMYFSKHGDYCGDDYWTALVDICCTVAVSTPSPPKLTLRQSRRLALSKGALRLALFARVGETITKTSVMEAARVDPKTVEEGDWEGWPRAFLSFRAAAEGPTSGRKAEQGFEEFAMARRGMLDQVGSVKQRRQRPAQTTIGDAPTKPSSSRAKTHRIQSVTHGDEDGWTRVKENRRRTFAKPKAEEHRRQNKKTDDEKCRTDSTMAEEDDDVFTRSDYSDDYFSDYEFDEYVTCWATRSCGSRARLEPATVSRSRLLEHPFWGQPVDWDTQYSSETRNRKWDTHNLNQPAHKGIESLRGGRLARRLPKQHSSAGKRWKDSSRRSAYRDSGLLQEMHCFHDWATACN